MGDFYSMLKIIEMIIYFIMHDQHIACDFHFNKLDFSSNHCEEDSCLVWPLNVSHQATMIGKRHS